jgi:hypothetical protein
MQNTLQISVPALRLLSTLAIPFRGHNLLTQSRLIGSLSLALFAASAGASPVYVATSSGQFGIVDPTTGAFTQIGPTTPDPLGGLVQGTNGYLGISFSGNLDSVNPSTGTISVIGATGLGFNAFDTAELAGTVYATDFSNNIYTVNIATGAATLLGYTGIPPAPELINPADFCDEALFAAGGNLYATFDGIDGATLAPVIDPEIYRINPSTGVATPVTSTSLFLDAAVDIDGVVYAFQTQPSTLTSHVLSLDLATGNTTFVANVDSTAAFIDGAAAAPEPAPIMLAGIGIAAILVSRRRSRRS